MQVANKHLEKADRFLQKGKLEPALEEFLLAWKEEPANDSIVYTVAELYQKLNKNKESRECYLFLYYRAVERADYQKMVDLLRKVQVLGPVEPARLIAAAQILEKPKPDLAAEQYRRAMELAGEKQPEIVLSCIQGLVRMQPDSIEMNQKLAEAAVRAGNTAAATSAWNKVAALFSSKGELQQAAAALAQVCRIMPKDLAARTVLARAYMKSGELAKVFTAWDDLPQALEDREVLGLLAGARCAAGQWDEAEALYWKALDSVPGTAGPLLEIAKGYTQRNDTARLTAFLERLDEQARTRKSQRELVPLAEGLAKLEPEQNVPYLERLVSVLERLQLDSSLANLLSTLFDLYFQESRFQQACEIQDRIITVDPYNPLSTQRLESLQGKVDPARLHELAARLGINLPGSPGDEAAAETPARRSLSEGPADAASSPLRDLMLQAEIFMQYGMQDKAREKLERVVAQFPGEEHHNDELALLLERAGVPAGARPAAPAAVADGATPGDVRADLKRMSEISRNLGRQATVKAVLVSTVNDIGKLWQVSRCVAGLATPHRPPTLALEYIATGVSPSDPAKLGKLVMALQQATLDSGAVLAAEDVRQSPVLRPLQDILAALQVESLAGIPLRDGEQEIGMLILEQCGATRPWKINDLAALEALAEQVVLAISNVRLRSLVRTLAVTDEQSGLLHRDSYLTCLLSEAERMRLQKTPLSLVLLQCARPDAGKRPPGGAGKDLEIEQQIQKCAAAVHSHLRQNDIAVRYAPDTFAFILPGAAVKDAAIVAEKLRKLFQSLRVEEELLYHAAACEAVRDPEVDGVDCVTELVNRAEEVFDSARRGAGEPVKISEPPMLPR